MVGTVANWKILASPKGQQLLSFSHCCWVRIQNKCCLTFAEMLGILICNFGIRFKIKTHKQWQQPKTNNMMGHTKQVLEQSWTEGS